MLQLQQKTHPKVFQLGNNIYMPAYAFWLSYMGGTWSEVDEYNLFKVDCCLRNVRGADPFPLLWFVGLSFFTGL